MQAESRIRPEPGRILIVDDEENIRKGLAGILTREGHEVREAASAEEALPLMISFRCEAAIVDIRMPGMSGVELLHEIRQRWPHVSVVLLTGHGTLDTAMAAIKEGAHDYLLKPTQPDAILETITKAITAARRQRERSRLMASLRTSLERLGELPESLPAAADTVPERRLIRAGTIQIDLQAHEVRLDGAPIALTPSEFQLLVALASRPGEVVDYVSLVRLSLDYDAEPWEARELIKRHVFALRQKIEAEPSSPRTILNVRGIGYRLVSPAGVKEVNAGDGSDL